MGKKLDKLRWNLFLNRYFLLYSYGIRNGLIQLYDQELIDNLSNVCYGGVPLSIMLLDKRFCDRKCYERGPLISLGFGDDDFRVVDAKINGLLLRDSYAELHRRGMLSDLYGEHCFVERTRSDGSVWVYDTSVGLVFEKNLYYRMQNPDIRVVNDRDTTLEYLKYEFLDDSDLNRDKEVLPMILPDIESNLEPLQSSYLGVLKDEISKLKCRVNYEMICSERENEMRSMGIIK